MPGNAGILAGSRQGCRRFRVRKSYVFKDARGYEYSFGFQICSYWPVDEQWRSVMQRYTQGAQNRVRYVRWLPTLHEIQSPLQSAYPVPMAKGSEERKLSVTL